MSCEQVVTLISGKKDVAASGTPEAISAVSVGARRVWISPRANNNGNVAIGDSSVSAGVSGQGVYIRPGDQPLLIEGLIDLHDIFVAVAQNNDGVVFTYERSKF